MLVVSDSLSFVLALCLGWLASALFCRHEIYCIAINELDATAIRAWLMFIGICFYLGSRGHFKDRLPLWHEMREVLVVSTAALCLNVVLAATYHEQGQLLFIATVWFLLPVGIMTLRQVTKRLLSASGIWEVPVLIIGDQNSVADAAALLSLKPALGYRVAGSLDPSLAIDNLFAERCKTALKQLGAHRVIVSHNTNADIESAIVQSIVRARIPFSTLPQATMLPVQGRSDISILGQNTILTSYRDNIGQRTSRFVKWSADFFSSLTVITGLTPLFLALSLIIRRDGGDAFFGHKRVGAGGRMFNCLKFRTMIMNSREVLDELLTRDPAAALEWADTQKLVNDPRITKVGKLLRATSLDEIPQLLNVLRREMSLVGPRPIVDQEVKRYAEDIEYYYQIKPGLTGLWQVSGRSDTTYKQRVQLDSWYVRNWSLWNDVTIVARTVPAVLRQSGAC